MNYYLSIHLELLTVGYRSSRKHLTRIIRTMLDVTRTIVGTMDAVAVESLVEDALAVSIATKDNTTATTRERTRLIIKLEDLTTRMSRL